MTSQLSVYIVGYGYLAFFLIVLVQELGIPGPPNELVLFSIGMLGHRYGLSYVAIILLTVFADILGSWILYTLFYYGTGWLMKRKPSWLPLPRRRMFLLAEKMQQNAYKTICLGKITPFLRGIIPVAAGMVQVSVWVYIQALLVTAIIWTGGWMTVGWLMAG